ncbi:MAG: response regulator [Nitrospirota bacterium]|nr:response regulator [Nitrospirota bacterium]MDX2420778.1 response regulator [Nitrospirota bacterium]
MKKILIIEDDEQVRDSVYLSLESVGYEVMEAATCKEGLQNHKKFGASVIISDEVSLETEGGEILRSLCQQSPHIPLITLTGTISEAVSTKSDIQPKGPMSPHTLQKPFTLDELLATVQSAFIR